MMIKLIGKRGKEQKRESNNLHIVYTFYEEKFQPYSFSLFLLQLVFYILNPNVSITFPPPHFVFANVFALSGKR